MSQQSRDAANKVKEELGAAKYHLDRALEKVQAVPDKDLQRKVREAVTKSDDAHTHVDKALEGK